MSKKRMTRKNFYNLRRYWRILRERDSGPDEPKGGWPVDFYKCEEPWSARRVPGVGLVTSWERAKHLEANSKFMKPGGARTVIRDQMKRNYTIR